MSPAKDLDLPRNGDRDEMEIVRLPRPNESIGRVLRRAFRRGDEADRPDMSALLRRI